MLLGHSCKVKSKQAVKIEEAMYTHFLDVVDCDEFHHALENARIQLHAGNATLEKQQYQKEFSLPLKRNFFGLYTIPVYINHKCCSFIVDSGAQISGIRELKAKQLQLPATLGTIGVGSIGGTQKELHGVQVDSLQLGGLEYHNAGLVVLNDDDFALRFKGIDLFTFDGIIGWDILSQIDFEIDDIKKRFIVLKNHLQIPYPNMLKGSFPCFIMCHPNGNTSLYGFDSGSKVSWIGEDAIQRFHYQVIKETTSLGFGVHGIEKLHMKVVDHCTLFLDKAQIDLSYTMSGRTNLFPSFSFDGILGNEICIGRRIRFINSANMVLIA